MKTLIVAIVAAVVGAFLALLYADVINTAILRGVDYTPIETPEDEEPGGGWSDPWWGARGSSSVAYPVPEGWTITG